MKDKLLKKDQDLLDLEEEHEEVIEEEIEIDETINRNISQAIKQRRLAKSLTLESIAKGICSLSYLSKIENVVINAHASYLEAICERLDINFEELVKQQQLKDLNEVLRWYLYENYEKIEELFNVLDNPYYNATDGLIRIVYYLYKNDFTSVEHEIMLLNDVKTTLTSNEMNIFTLLVTEYYLKTKQFKKIEDSLSLLMTLSKTVTTYQPLYFEQLFIAAYHLDIRHLVNYCFESLKEERFINYPFWRLYKLQIMLLEIESREKHNRSLEDLDNLVLDQTFTPFQEGIRYYQALIYINNGRYQQAYKFLNSKDNLSAREYVLLVYSAYLSNEVPTNELLEMINDFKFASYEKSHKNFLTYLRFKIESLPRNQLAQLMKYHLLPTNDLSPFPLYSRVYLDELFRLGFKTSYQRLLCKFYP